MPAPRTDITYSGFEPRYPATVTFKTRPHKLYLTAERALNKDEFGMILYWDTGLRLINPDVPSGSNYKYDSRGEAVRIPHPAGASFHGYLGWLRVDELNVPLNVVPLKYFTPQKRDVGRMWAEVAESQGLSGLHGNESMIQLIQIWNRPKHSITNVRIGDTHVGKTFIIDMGFPPTSDENLFKNEYLENNRYQNANQSSMVSVKLIGRPNTRYMAKTSAPRNPNSENHEVYVGVFPTNPNQSVGFSVNEDMVFITDHKGEIELSFYNDGLAGVNADYTKFLSYEYWVEILVHPDQSMAIPPDATISMDGQTYELFYGENRETELELKPGVNQLIIEGNGIISFEFEYEVMG